MNGFLNPTGKLNVAASPVDRLVAPVFPPVKPVFANRVLAGQQRAESCALETLQLLGGAAQALDSL